MNKKHLSVALSSLLILPLLVPSGPANYATAEEADQEVVIVYKNEDGKEAAIEQSVEIKHEFESVPAVSATVSAEELQNLVDNPDIAYVERNIPFQITGSEVETLSTTPKVNSAEQMNNWNYDQVAPNTMWEQGFTGHGVKVAVIDSGISSHPELKIAGGISTYGSQSSSNYADDNGHGTHVAGIIAADSGNGKVVGMAPGVSLYAVKALGADGKGTLDDVLEGIDWAITNQMDIINLSLGTSEDSQLLHDMVDKAHNLGILVVASAGNSGTTSNTDQDTVNYPAKYDSVIAVAAVDQYLNRADFSSTGSTVEVAAPGTYILSTYPGDTHILMNGTSQAAPHVAGELALLMEKNPSATAANLRSLLTSYSVDLGAPGRDNLFGSGLVTFKSQSDTTAPAEVSAAAVKTAATDSLTLGWDNPTNSDFKEVRVYQGTNSSFTTVTQTTYQASSLIPDTNYEFFLKTVDTAGNESKGVQVSGKTQALPTKTTTPSESETSAPMQITEPVQEQPTQTAPAPAPYTPPAAIQLPATPTPPPSGGSAQIPSGGGGSAPAPVPAAPAPAPKPAAPAVVPAKPAVTPAPTPTVKAPSVPVTLPFADVAPTFWGRETVAWAYERGLVKGYGNGQLKPNATVTEAEFLAILIRTFEPEVKNAVTGTWSNTYYARAKQLNLPLKGYSSSKARSQNLTRLQVAEMLAAANGTSHTGNDAIRYVLSAGIAKGSSKTEKTIASFNGNRTLTRAEALQFVKNLTENGTGSLK